MADAKRIRDGLGLFEIDLLFHGHFHSAELGLASNEIRQVGRGISVGSAGGRVNYCREKTRHFLVIELAERELVIYDFRNKGLGTWVSERHTFEIQPRRSIHSGEQ